MIGTINHIQFNVASKASIPFYKDLLTSLGMNVVVEMDAFLGVSDGHTTFWAMPATDESQPLNRNAAGINHLGLRVDSRAEVDEFVETFMKPRGIQPQWDTPRERPEFGNYYQVMFEDPEGLAIEVFHAE